jgi:hypothetical protein
MQKLLSLAALLVTFASLGGTAAASTVADSGATAEESTEAGAPALAQPRPSWYTGELEARVLAAGREGVEVALSPEQQLELNCLGTSPPSASTTGVSVQAVSAGGCMVAPHGCTMNFIFTDGTSNYVGTAGHCVQGGRTVVMQVASRVSPVEEGTILVTLAAIGQVAKSWNAGIGKDFALVKIDPGWPVVTGVGGALGPTGVFCGDPLGQPVLHYGHGYIFFVEQGHPKVGEVIPDVSLIFNPSAEGFNWVGYGLPGDSGSGVMNAAGLAVGDLTHGLAVAGVPVPGLSFGTTAQAIFNLVGPGYSLVTVDGRSVSCAGGLIGI